MRRAIASLAALGLVLTLAAPAAAQGRPEIVRLEPGVLDEAFLAGTCDFRAELVDSSTNSKLLFFPPADDGSQLMRSTGGYTSTLTNLDTGESIDIHYYSKIDFTFLADGTTLVTSSGVVFAYVFEGDDLSIFDPGLYLITGTYSAHVDANGFALAPETVKGKVRNLCEELS